MEELVAEVRVALPYITERRMDLLVKYFSENGVHSKSDVSKLEAVDLVNTLGTADAKKLVGYFKYGHVFHDVASEKVRTEQVEGVKVAYEELNTKLDEEHAKRQEVHEDILRAVDDNVMEISEIHDATLEDIKETRKQAAQANEEVLRKMREEEKLRAERRAESRRRMEEELKRLESKRSNPVVSMARGLLEAVRGTTQVAKEATQVAIEAKQVFKP